jgi:hypothetical protein
MDSTTTFCVTVAGVPVENVLDTVRMSPISNPAIVCCCAVVNAFNNTSISENLTTGSWNRVNNDNANALPAASVANGTPVKLNALIPYSV